MESLMKYQKCSRIKPEVEVVKQMCEFLHFKIVLPNLRHRGIENISFK